MATNRDMRMKLGDESLRSTSIWNSTKILIMTHLRCWRLLGVSPSSTNSLALTSWDPGQLLVRRVRIRSKWPGAHR